MRTNKDHQRERVIAIHCISTQTKKGGDTKLSPQGWRNSESDEARPTGRPGKGLLAFLLLQHLGAHPRSLVRLEGVDGGVGDGVLGDALVVRHGRVLKPLAPKDFRGKVRSADLEFELAILLKYESIHFL